jgi:hypothetical protein
MWTTSVIFKHLLKVNSHPMGENSPNLVPMLPSRNNLRILHKVRRKNVLVISIPGVFLRKMFFPRFQNKTLRKKLFFCVSLSLSRAVTKFGKFSDENMALMRCWQNEQPTKSLSSMDKLRLDIFSFLSNTPSPFSPRRPARFEGQNLKPEASFRNSSLPPGVKFAP